MARPIFADILFRRGAPRPYICRPFAERVANVPLPDLCVGTWRATSGQTPSSLLRRNIQTWHTLHLPFKNH
ncbi:MAG: hypothetical protein HDS84_07515 [Bacteroidales bacterium]|nr:hypothetical protein [Bacteroidales bacterium]